MEFGSPRSDDGAEGPGRAYIDGDMGGNAYGDIPEDRLELQSAGARDRSHALKVEMDVTEYQEQVLGATGQITADVLEVGVFTNLLLGWGQTLWNVMIEEGPNLLFKVLLFIIIVYAFRKLADFAKKIIDHWLEGLGGEYNPFRKRASELIRLVRDLDEVRKRTGALMIGTTAKNYDRAISFNELRTIANKKDVCLLFGTGWGLAPRIFTQLDAITEPITGVAEYNHISVRSAVAIIIDRLIGR